MLTSVRGFPAAAALTGAVLAATPVLADETDPPGAFTVTGEVALVTDYRFRGLSQSNGRPAVQAGIDVGHKSGFHVSVWASSIDFPGAGGAVYGGQEVDISGGWTGPIGSGLTGDIGLFYYAYPGGHVGKAEFFESYASISATLGPVTGKAGLDYAWKQAALNLDDGSTGDSLYLYGEVGGGIPRTPLSLSAHLGYATGALSPKFATGASMSARSGGFDWSVGATFNVTKNLSLTGEYVGVEGNSIAGYSNDTVVGTLKFSF
ncbi:MAG: TorF family putative porin [Novosphingobium sp.]|nr:TorF family putative porin [Novosphingobium sp.]